MERQILEFQTEAEWLGMRKANLNSTETSALFGASPYVTEFSLYHLKTGQIGDGFEANERMKWGNRLEAAIAEGVAEDYGLVVEPFKVYMQLPVERIGSSFDYKVVGITTGFDGDETYRDLFRQFGEGILEVKNVDGFIFRKTWSDDGADIEAPPHIEFQVQHQLLVSGLQWSIIAPLVNGNTPHPTYRVKSDKAHEAIIKKCADFWHRVDNRVPPEPNFNVDAATIGQLLLDDDGQEVDMSDNEYLAQLCVEEMAAGKEKRDAEASQKAIKAEILTIIGTNRKVTVGPMNVNAKKVDANPGRVLTDEDIGDRIGVRSGSVSIRISQFERKANPGTLVDETMIGKKVGERSAFRSPRVTQPKPKKGK